MVPCPCVLCTVWLIGSCSLDLSFSYVMVVDVLVLICLLFLLVLEVDSNLIVALPEFH